MDNDVKLGRFISLILRHKPETIDIILDENGWADTKELIEKISKSGREINFETLERIVNENNKKRYSFNKDKTKIRAVQGHSIKVNLELKGVVPPVILYHGTAFKNLENIKKDGIKKMNRQHVHLSADIETAKNVATRHSGKYIILEIDTEAMLKENYKFYLSENKVWLTDFIPSKFIKF
ncbi:RNA 2'-phosphotransferase [Fusobacterium nucleatum]|uniref:RNA 2'-phosphotransferase n=1 Tax=Fusobacterium nucleatum TaxID=851 RepID=UPI0006CB5C50|nr:RNA 2'-phosphotransferase [Fusobacterium nucleatum subsp. nucleatum]